MRKTIKNIILILLGLTMIIPLTFFSLAFKPEIINYKHISYTKTTMGNHYEIEIDNPTISNFNSALESSSDGLIIIYFRRDYYNYNDNLFLNYKIHKGIVNYINTQPKLYENLNKYFIKDEGKNSIIINETTIESNNAFSKHFVTISSHNGFQINNYVNKEKWLVVLSWTLISIVWLIIIVISIKSIVLSNKINSISKQEKYIEEIEINEIIFEN